MDVLFTCVVGYGHFNPMVPLARALQAAGHSVRFATDPGFSAHIRSVGFEAEPAGLDQRDAWASFLAATPGFAEAPPEDHLRLLTPGMFGTARVPRMLEDLGRLLDSRPADLVVHDSAELAGAIAAEVAGIAHAEHSFGILRPMAVRSDAADVLAPISDRLGVRNPGVGGNRGELYLDVCPPGTQQPEIAEVERVQRLRPIGFDDAADAPLPDWVADLPVRPTVYVTMGTVFNDVPAVFRAVLDGIRDEPVNVIVTVGPKGDPASLGPQPANVHVERYIPQSRLLPHCDLLVSHAGSGALLGALNAGVPILAIPQGADQFMNAERIVEVGLGLRLLPAELAADAVRDSTRQLLRDDRFRSVARRERTAIAEMPTPETVVSILEALVDGLS
jgi:UDP:flavonoid glycosyltransferase YjiC (YdhE family)